ncbi:MAG TPA: mechanosensitive ion channel domain-containing protein [Anaerolineae bacterium]
MIESMRQLLAFYLDLDAALQAKLTSSLIIIVSLWVVRLLALRFVHRRFRDNTRALYNWRKVMEYVIVIVGLFLVGRIWLEGVQSLATYLGILSAGLAIALQDLIVNLAGWFFIIWRKPFVVGNRVQIGEHKGDVIDIRLFEFSMLEIGAGRVQAEQSTGRVIHVPNGKVFTEVLANTHQGLPYVWNEIPVLVTFESDWEKAKAILVDIINRHAPDIREKLEEYTRKADRFVISYANVRPTVYTKVASSGVLLTMRYLVDPRKLRNSEQIIWEAILRAFAGHWDIDFAYETQREYIHWREHKQPGQAAEEGISPVSPLYDGELTDAAAQHFEDDDDSLD